MDPNETLRQLRAAIDDAASVLNAQADRDRDYTNALEMALANLWEAAAALDSWLRVGGIDWARARKKGQR